MMTREEISATLRKIIQDYVPELAGTQLNEDTVLNTETAIDSMGFILVLSKLEGALDIKIPDDQWNQLSTFGDVVDACMAALAAKQ